MSSIGGKIRENEGGDYVKRVGLFEAKVIAINPTLEQFKTLLNIEVKEDSKQADYLGESKDKNTMLRIDFWLEDVKTGDKFKTSFFLEDRERKNKDESKSQFINEIGMCAWADDPNNLPDWFTKRSFRPAYSGEEDLYNFMRIWLGKLDYRDAETVLQLEWKKLMKGNVKDLKDQVDGEYSSHIGALATVISRDVEGETKQFQGIYSRAFLPSYALKSFKLVDYNSRGIQGGIKAKKSSDLKPHERFVLNVIGEYGCKDYYTFSEIQDYNSEDNMAASDATISSEDDEY